MNTKQTERAMARLDRGTQKRHVHKMVDSPVGRLQLVATDEGLAGILWEKDRPNRVRLMIEAEDHRHPVLIETERQLGEYFAGQRKEFALPLDLAGTAFQRKVWNALLTIPFGETRSYAQIARQIGNPGAVRAVGAANGRNPVSIVAPCHRVIGSTGKLTGFAGGLDAKAHLLALEGSEDRCGRTRMNPSDEEDGSHRAA
jgi:methylated-DNA-[protein]-cysteine S-methyltransferase